MSATTDPERIQAMEIITDICLEMMALNGEDRHPGASAVPGVAWCMDCAFELETALKEFAQKFGTTAATELLCDACNVRPGWTGEHRCHTPEKKPAEMIVGGTRVVGVCSCVPCTPPTKEEIDRILGRTT